MATSALSEKINDLFCRSKWEKARKLLEAERQENPEDHWILTQLGVTFYEQHQYDEALQLFLASLAIVPDCPLTLWNLAGTLQSIGKYDDAVKIYTWLLESNKSSEEDPCWESKAWTDALKMDCLFRLGACFQQMGKKLEADHCYHQYLNLLSVGMEGSYPAETVLNRMGELHSAGKQNGKERHLQQAVASTLRISGIEKKKRRGNAPPDIDVTKLLSGRRGAKRN